MISFVQSNGYDDPSGSGSPTQSCAFSSANAAGNLLVAFVGYTGSGAAISLTDTAGNPWLSCGPRVEASGVACQLFYAANCLGAANTVNAAYAPAVAYPALYVFEYSGAATAAPLDTQASAAPNSATPTAGPITTGAANELIVSAIYGYAHIASAGSGYTARRYAGGGGLEDQISGAAGSYSASWNMASANNAAIQIAAFKAAGLAVVNRLGLLGCGS